jgi:hypothetical protein
MLMVVDIDNKSTVHSRQCLAGNVLTILWSEHAHVLYVLIPVRAAHLIGRHHELLVEVGLAVEEAENGGLQPVQAVAESGGCGNLEAGRLLLHSHEVHDVGLLARPVVFECSTLGKMGKIFNQILNCFVRTPMGSTVNM